MTENEIKQFEKLYKDFAVVKDKKWIKGLYNRYSSVGVTFEKALGITSEYFEIPDYGMIEIKARCIDSVANISLFRATPDSYVFEIKRIHEKYGYSDSNNPRYKVFRIAVNGKIPVRISNRYYFILDIDRINEKILLNVFNRAGQLVDNYTSWSFEMIKEKLLRKLSFLAIAYAERRYLSGEVHFKYTVISFYRLRGFDVFLDMIEDGKIDVAFMIGVFKSGRRIGQVHDHGTCFKIAENMIPELFDKISLY